MGTTTLRYEGRGSLSFRDGSNTKRKVVADEFFLVDDETAEILLTDPNVVPFDLPRGNPATGEAGTPPAPSAPTKAQLVARAEELTLELPKRATNAQLTAAIAAEEARLADEAAAAAAAEASSSGEGDQGGEGTPADDPDATATGEAGTPPETVPGAITLGDLPAGAVRQG